MEKAQEEKRALAPQPPLDTLPILKYFKYDHLQHDGARLVSSLLHDSAHTCVGFAVMAEMRGEPVDRAELVAGLRKLLEAKDCFVRARLR